MNEINTAQGTESELEALLAPLRRVSEEMAQVIVGQEAVVEQLQLALLAGGHCLLEGVPGLAKTLMVQTMARCLDLEFKRVQFTPDLMPADLIGTEVLQRDAEGQARFEYEPGPLFTQVLLADEINRTPPRTQAALLEAMAERAVSFAGQTRPLPRPFFVLATQNPLEQAGTYPLPEAQLDRFIIQVMVTYPELDDEVGIIRSTTGNRQAQPRALLNAEQVLALQRWVREVVISEALIDYAARLTRATRPGEGAGDAVREYLRWGASPRAGQSLVMVAKARALLKGRLAVTLDDIQHIAAPVLRHRLLLNFHAQADGITSDHIVTRVVGEVPAPASPLG